MTADTSLQGLAVVELAGSVAGGYCSKLFADGGADVTVVGPGSLSTHEQTYLQRRVRRVENFDAIDLAGVDVLIESASSNPLEPMELEPMEIAHEQLVHVRISPLGQAGERADWKSSDLIDYAMSGHGYLNGDPDKEPVGGAPNQPAVAAGLHAFIGAMAALLARPRLGHGQTVDIAHLDVMVSLHRVTLLQQLMTSSSPMRTGRRRKLGAANGLYACQDGWVSIVAATPAQTEALRAIAGIQDDAPDVDGSLERWCRDQPVVDVVDLLQLVRVPAAPVLSSGEVLQDPQLCDRKFFERLNLPAGPVLVPGPAVSFQHVQPSHDDNIEDQPPHRGLTPMWGNWRPGDIAGGPLAGLKVLDLTRVWAGPLSARMLRDLGADVIAVEAPNQRGSRTVPDSYVHSTGYFPDNDPGDEPWNRNVFVAKFGLGKKSIALDLHTEAGRSVLTRLITQSHVLIENFSTRVMPQLGFDEDRLHELNPDLIYLSISAYGRSGPAADWVGYGSTIDSHAGLTRLAGYSAIDPLRGGVAWPDPIAALHGTSAVLSWLWNGQQSAAGGATIELSQLESAVAALGDQVVAAQLDGERDLAGNRSTDFLAQGVYRCRGDDQWIAVSIPDETALQALLSVVERPDLGNDLQPDSFHALASDHDLFDRTLTEIAAAHDGDELATRLQRGGVPAAKVATAADVLNDPHLRSRGRWATIDQPHIGQLVVPKFPIELSASPALDPAPAPTLGEHNHQILTAAGYQPSEIAVLLSTGVLATAPPA